jgi:glycyl-tRNA synthetase beta chain
MSPVRGGAGTFLLEIGAEEIPARMMPAALADLATAVREAVTGARLVPDGGGRSLSITALGTPRRLACRVEGLLPRQPDEQDVPVTGPPVRAAFDAEGRPTKAAEGFARAHGVHVSALRRLPTPRGECVGLLKSIPGRDAKEVLGETLPERVLSLNFPKTMRWGAGQHRFVRPIHSIVALLDDEVVEMTIAGVAAGRETFGHRVGGKTHVRLERAADYLEALEANGVLADPVRRREAIEAALAEAARTLGGRIAPPPGAAEGAVGDAELLAEVTFLVEWPTVISGEFDPSYLDLPPEVLVTAMRHHQKYFSLADRSGRLLNRFLAVANARDDRSGSIRRGNEWVLRARLADARFFWEEDRRVTLGSRAAELRRLSFHEKLGSYAAKVERMRRIAATIAPFFESGASTIDPEALGQAVDLSKCDLVTQMVKEFPELQGIVGGLFARLEGAPEKAAAAVYEQYRPLGPRDPVPPTLEGAALSLADRLDSQTGLFLLGHVPSGSRDPYALRRSVQGVCRILIEGKVSLSLSKCLEAAFAAYGSQGVAGEVPEAPARAALLEFYAGRLQHLAEEAGRRHDSVRAALAAGADDPFDAWLRMDGLERARQSAAFEVLVLIHKRIRNILGPDAHASVRPGIFREAEEKSLHRAVAEARPAIEAAVGRRAYPEALRAILALGPELNRFFEKVMVMSEDREERENRLALLGSIAALFLRVADFSEIVLDREPAGRAARGRPA